MRILIGCECSGKVRTACRTFEHDAWSCDVKPAEDGSPYHLQQDVRTVLADGWDAFIVFPDCTYLSVSGLHWNHFRPGRAEKTEAALVFVEMLMAAPIPRIVVENPVGCISTRIRQPDQMIQPYEFGEDASKLTCLWLKGLPKLRPTQRVPGRQVVYEGRLVERWANQTDSGQNRLSPSEHRAADRARTYDGIAQAMANQWFGAEAHLTGLPLFDVCEGPAGL